MAEAEAEKCSLHFNLVSGSAIVQGSVPLQVVILFVMILACIGRSAKIRRFPIDPKATFFQYTTFACKEIDRMRINRPKLGEIYRNRL